MKFNLEEAFAILNSTPDVIDDQLKNLNKNWLMSNEGEGTWTPAEIVCHLIHCEEDDWIPRMKIILNENENKNFEPLDRTYGFEKAKNFSIKELIDEFKKLREKNLKYFDSIDLNEDQLNKCGIHPDFGEVTLKQLLSTWVVDDLSHIAQINRVMAQQYKVETGPWKKYLPILEQRNHKK